MVNKLPRQTPLHRMYEQEELAFKFKRKLIISKAEETAASREVLWSGTEIPRGPLNLSMANRGPQPLEPGKISLHALGLAGEAVNALSDGLDQH